jgi:CHAD domain-containing protein
MATAIERGKLIFRKTERELSRLTSDQHAEAVHGFRTTTRRLEVLLEQLLPSQGRNNKKLLKLLHRIRRRAGKVRDLDVQLAALRSLKVPLEPRRKTQLMQRLIELRIQHEKRLSKLLTKNEVREIRRRLRKASNSAHGKTGRDPLQVSREILRAVPLPEGAASDRALHQYRVAVKRARYAAEFAANSGGAAQLVAELKRLQDALGNWHDWMTLTQTASEQFGDANQSALVAALNSVTRGKLRQAVAALAAAPVTLPEEKRKLSSSEVYSGLAARNPLSAGRSKTAA